MTVKLIFYLFAAILIFAAVRVITVRNPVHAALYLVLAFFTTSGIWLILQAEFLAIALVLVYVGAVMVLFLFILMMLDINLAPLRENFTRYLPVGLTVGILIFVEMTLVVKVLSKPAPADLPAASSNIQLLGEQLYSLYVYPFEIAAVILLVAMIAAIALTLRPKRWSKYRKPEQQVNVRRQDRLRLINMPAEPKD